MEVIALVVSGLALATAIASAIYVRGQRNEVRRQADIAEAADLRRKFGWRLEPVYEGLFNLRNVGWASARDVQVSSDQLVEFEKGVQRVDLEPQQGIPLILALSDRKGGNTVEITWTATWRQGDEEVVEDHRRTWREPAPALPVPAQKVLRQHGLL